MRWLLFIAFFAGVLFASSISQAAKVRIWMSGKYTIEAKFVELNGDTVVLKKAGSGKILRVPLSKFSQKDLEYVKNLIKKEKGPPDGDLDSDQDDDDSAGSDKESSPVERPKGERRKPPRKLDPNRILSMSDRGLVLPSGTKKWLNSSPITTESIGNKALVIVFFDEKQSSVVPHAWAHWFKTSARYKGQPIIFIAVCSGNSRAVVSEVIRRYRPFL